MNCNWNDLGTNAEWNRDWGELGESLKPLLEQISRTFSELKLIFPKLQNSH